MGLPIISVILTEDTVRALPDDILFRVAECSTEAVTAAVIKYLENPKADEEVRRRVESAYGESIFVNEYLTSKDTLEKVDKIVNLDYSSVDVGVPIATLQEWADAINSILSSKYAVPYIKPVSGVLLEDLKSDLKELSKGNPEIKQFYEKLCKFGKFFRDPKSTAYRGTSVKRIVRNREKYEVMERGIQFLIEKKKSGATLSSWRFL